jgi:lipopolysaccharide export system protein LptC
VQLFGNAVVKREAIPGGGAARSMSSRRVSAAFTQAERVRSDQPVVLIRGNDRFTADAMEYDHLDQVLQLRGRVRGVLMPAALR